MSYECGCDMDEPYHVEAEKLRKKQMKPKLIQAKGFAILHPMNGGMILAGDMETLRRDCISNARRRYGRDNAPAYAPEELETWNQLRKRLNLKVIPVTITARKKGKK